MSDTDLFCDVQVLHSCGGGQCLFDSVRQILRAPGADVNFLRHLVAKRVLNPKYDDCLDAWVTVYAQMRSYTKSDDYDVMATCAQVAPLFVNGQPPTKPYTSEERRAVYDQMMKPSYWGHEYAISVFREELGLQLLVLYPGDFTTALCGLAGTPNDEGQYPECIGFVWLEKWHYRPVQLGTNLLWSQSGLSSFIRSELERAARVPS